ncbi:putative T7SS-secreted protein [Streptomyces sp. NPDC099050]|uniref:putative T7SS-secreted protein n=1 Tax=Streptomyces sp. NPDC099050 TaxID=3366100 RepID=UPI0038027236
MGWRDFVPDGAEDWAEDRVEDLGDAVEWAGDKTAGLAEDVGLDGAGDWIRDKSRSAANRLGADVAELELGQTEDPNKLVYGSVSKIRAQVSHLNDFKASFDKVGNGLKGMGEPDGLKGRAAEAFRESVAKEPPRWFKAAEAFGKAADAMGRFAETVEWAQAQAKEALEEYNRAKKVSTEARTAHNKLVDTYNNALKAKQDPLPPRPSENFTDPGTAIATAAQDKLDTARKQRNDVAETVRTAVRAARDTAPPKPSYAKQLGDGMDYLDLAKTHLAGGVIKGTAGIVNFARALNPMDPYNLTHPAEYVTNLNNTAAGLVTMANDPLGAGKKMLDEFMKDPSEGIGKLIPELVGSKGLGSLKKVGSAASHLDDLKGPGRTSLDKDGPGSASRTGKDTTCVDDPVDVATGRMVLPQTDLALPGSLPLAFTRTFESSYQAGRWFGRRWASTLDQRLEIDAVGIVLVGEDGSILAYPHPAPGVPVLPTHGRRWPLSVTPAGEFTVTDPETGRVWHFTAEGILVQLGDRHGAWIAYEYDADGTPTGMSHSGGYRVHLTTSDGRITSLSLADGTKVLDYTYTDGDLTEVINSSELPLRFGYDEHARIVSWTDTNGRHFDYTYDDQDRCTAQSGTNGHVDSRFTYEDGVTTVIGALGHQRRYVVDDRSLVVAETDANGATTRFEWGPFNRLLKRTDPLGLATRITYDDNGLVTSVERTDGRRTAMQYNALCLPERVTRPDGTSVRRTYDERGNLLSVSGPSGADTRYTYDDRGHLSSVTNTLGETSSIRCNAAGLVVESANPLGAVTRYTYDAFGRVATVTDQLGGITRLTWSVEGRLLRRVEPDGSEQSWVYDGEGNCLTHTDANGGQSVYEFGDFDALVARTGPDGARYSFAHDLELRLTEVTNPQGLTWTYEYDPAGRLTSETDFDGRTLNYAYDAANRLAARTNALGETVRYEYNAIGQTVRKDVAGAVTTYEYDHSDQLAQAVGPDVTLTRVRNREGLLHSETVNGRTLSYTYDELGRTARRTTPSGTVSEWSYDAAGRRASLMASGRTLTFEYDAVGRETVRRIGAGVTLAHGFDEVGRLTEQHLTGIDGGTLQRRGYSYRPDGHLTAVDDALGGVRTFTLDAAARVTSVEAGAWTERYAYDEAGNQTSASWPVSHPDTGSAAGPRTYTGNRIVSAGGVRYEHDVQGRVVLRQKARLSRKPDTWRYSWDAEDRLVGVTTPDGTVWRYIYDPLGRRAAKQCLSATGEVVEEVVFTWEGANLCEQTTRSAQLPHPVALTWEHRGLHPLTQTERILAAPTEEIDSRFFSIVTDLVGTPTELVDERGEVTWRTRSTLWGATTWNRDASTYTPLRFPGQYFDPESGLHYNVFRTYDPETARYLSPDPLGLAPAPNPMAYVHNPHTWSDHLGLAPDECRVTVYRKQTEHPLSQRVHIDENGNVTIDGNNHLYVNMSGELRHTLEFRGDNGQIVAFDVPKSFVDDIRARAVPQEQPDGLGFTKQEWKQVKQIYPEISDPTRGTDLYGLPGEVLDQMRKVIIPGSGRIVQDS